MSTHHDRALAAPYAEDEGFSGPDTEAAIEEMAHDSIRLGEAIADYWTGITFKCDGPDVLTEWTLALAGAEKLMDAIAHGEPLPDDQMQAFRALCRQVEEAKRRQARAITDAVDLEMVA